MTSFQGFKLSEKQVSPTFSYEERTFVPFRSKLISSKWLRNPFFAKLEALTWRHIHSQSPVFGLAILYPTGSEISRFWYIKTRGRKIAIEKFTLLYIQVHWGDLIEQIKKSVIYTLTITSIAILTVTSPVVINVLTRGLSAVETKDSFVLWLPKFKYQKTCLWTVSIAISS